MKFSRESLLIGLLLLSSLRARAAVEDENLSRVLKARSSSQLSHRLEMQHAEAHDSMVCDAELRTGKLPTACFKVLAAKRDDGESANELHSFDWLMQLCKDRASKSKSWKELEAADRQSTLPEECRSVAHERAADLRYADETEHPADLFGRLLHPDSSASEQKARR